MTLADNSFSGHETMKCGKIDLLKGEFAGSFIPIAQDNRCPCGNLRHRTILHPINDILACGERWQDRRGFTLGRD